MQNFFKVFQQTFWQSLGKIVTSLSTFIILGMVSRTYGMTGTGVFTLALTYLAMFYLLADFGFNAHVLKQVTGNRSSTPRSLRLEELQVTVEWQKLLGTRIIWSGLLVIPAVGLLPFWPFTNAQFGQAVLFGSLAIIASAIYTSTNLIFQQKLRYDLSVIASSIGTLFSLTIYLYLANAKFSPPFLLIAHFLGWVVIAVTSLILVRRLLPSISPIFDKKFIKGLFEQSWPIAATLALNVVYFRADAFMVAFYKSVSDVGIYNVAYSVFQSALVLPSFIMNSYYPLMLRSLNGLKLAIISLLGLAFLGTVVTFFLSEQVINILTGGGFVGASLSLRILSLGFPAFFLSALFMWLLVSQGRYKTLLSIYTLGLLINLILNFTYIPKYSFYAASYTTVISEYLVLIMQIMVLLFAKR